MKTLLVGDLHLKAKIILSMVEQKIRELGVKRVILLGDVTMWTYTNKKKC